MQASEVKLGDTVEVLTFLRVERIYVDKGSNIVCVDGSVKVSPTKSIFVVGIPLSHCIDFDPVKEAEWVAQYLYDSDSKPE